MGKRVCTNWLSDVWLDLVVQIARYSVQRSPSSMTNLMVINKHWYRCLNPNRAEVNVIWEHNICRAMFPRIPKTLRMRRWDRYYQYRYSVISKFRKETGDQTELTSQKVYRQFKVVENCGFDVDAVNALYRDPEVVMESGGGDDEKGLIAFEEQVDAEIGSHGLPKGYEWSLQCPVMALSLEQRGNGQYYCGVCKKNVFTVRNDQELAQRVGQGQCVQFDDSPVWPQAGQRTRGRVVRRGLFW